MEVKIKKVYDDSIVPTKAHIDDAGYDLYAHSVTDDDHGNIVYGTGVAFEIPRGYVGLVFPRSSNSKKDLLLSNCVGVIDSGFRGEVSFKFKPTCAAMNPIKTWWYIFVRRHINVNLGALHYITNSKYNIGDRIGQIIIMPYPEIEFKVVDELSKTERGINGYGSTGK